uniref:Uncharacterized protein n=1 Tax=Bactrocera dorsalis TaxID=27457 RepID=A0A034VVA2_BACDO
MDMTATRLPTKTLFSEIHGINTPVEKMPNIGPYEIDCIVADSCNTIPIFSTMYTSPIALTPKTITMVRITIATVVSLIGLRTFGLIKSSSNTAAKEFKRVETELNAALNTADTKRPGRPGNLPNTCITSNGIS